MLQGNLAPYSWQCSPLLGRLLYPLELMAIADVMYRRLNNKTETRHLQSHKSTPLPIQVLMNGEKKEPQNTAQLNLQFNMRRRKNIPVYDIRKHKKMSEKSKERNQRAFDPNIIVTRYIPGIQPGESA